jgi:hypothetical protein
MKILTVLFGIMLVAVALTPAAEPQSGDRASGCPYLESRSAEGSECPATGGGAGSDSCPYLDGRRAEEAAACPYSGTSDTGSGGLRSL